MHIAIIGSRGYPYVYSGYETFVKELSERLIKKNIKVTIYCHKNLFVERPKLINGIELVYIPTFEKKSISQLVHSFQSIIHACFRKYDVILFVNSANGPFGYICKFFKMKAAINVDGLEWLRPKWKGLGAKYYYFASWLSTKSYDVIINDSFEMQRIYKELFKKDSTVIAYGANIRYSEKPELINKWNLKQNDYYLIVGRLIPDNNSDLIIKEFVNSNTTKKLVIVGDVFYEDEYATKIKSTKDNRIIFTGYVTNQDELAELYHNCYIYFHGHEFGGTNPTLLKALAYGAPIIALDTQFNREVLLKGKYGLFFTKENGNLKSVLTKIEENDKVLSELKQISRNRIIKNYTWEKITEQYYQLFKEMSLNN